MGMLIIGIAGGTGSGKTTVARSIMRQLGKGNVNLISQDYYYHSHSDLSIAEREKINYDHPDAFENSLLLTHIGRLAAKESIRVPTYDFTRHIRASETIRVDYRPILLVEGIHVLTDPDVRNALDIKVFVDTDPDVRILRRVIRDIRERKRTFESVAEQYLKTVKPMHDAFIEPSKKYADIIIPEGGHNEVGIKMLVHLIEKYLG
jgi:uridine kinase